MFNSSIYRGFLMLALLMSASNTMSEDISFDYLQISYISGTVDLTSTTDYIDGSGIGLSLSLGFAPAFALTLAVESTTFDTFQYMDVDTSKLSTLGVTAHTSVAPGTAIFTNFSAVKAEVTVSDGKDKTVNTDMGAMIRIGLRHIVKDTFEVEAAASHLHVFDVSEGIYKLDARFFVRNRFYLGAGYTTGDGVNSLMLNVRVDI